MHMSNCRNINYGSRNSAQYLAPLPSKGGVLCIPCCYLDLANYNAAFLNSNKKKCHLSN